MKRSELWRYGALAAGLAGCGNATERDAACAPDPLVTSVESADPAIQTSCLDGAWFLQAYNGSTVPVTAGQPLNEVLVSPTPIATGNNPLAPTSTFAVFVSGMDQENAPPMFAFAQLTAVLDGVSPEEEFPVDASDYTGVQFDAIIDTAASGARFTVGNLYTHPAGDACTVVPGVVNSCYDDPGIQLAPSTTWMRYRVPFSSLVQLGFGNASPVGAQFPKDGIMHLRWDLGIPPVGPTEPWEIWVDGLTFY